MATNNLASTGNFFLFLEVLKKFQVVYGTFWTELFLACHRTFRIFLIRAGISEYVLVGSISSNVQNDLEGSLIIYKGKRFA